MENDKCEILWDFRVQADHEIYGRRPDVTVVQKDKNICLIIDFACTYDGRVDTKELEKTEYHKTRHKSWERYGTWKSKFTSSDKCPRNNTHKVKILAKGNRYWNSDNRAAQYCPRTHCLNSPKGSWGLKKLVATGLQ